MLDQKAVFDEMVGRFAKSAQAREKILNHSIYQAASSKFGGALEYMALGKLEKMYDSNQYDLIVLDTPPDAHALDFLARPNILAGFMEHKVMQWLIKPIHLAQKMGLTKILTMGEKLAGGIAEVTGVKALQVLAEFLVLMQDVIEGFNRSGERVLQILRSGETAFVMVTTLRSSAVRSALHMARQLKHMSYEVDRVIVNRTLPADVAQSIASFPSHVAELGPAKPWLQALFNSHRVAQKFAVMMSDGLARVYGRAIPAQHISEQVDDIHSTQAILRFAQMIGEN
jgi:anion-transporting  ArsA/GET3 family ATPase